ncbi:MAG: hypothetical protein ACI4F3_01520 [Enterocloster sp.]
MNETNENKGICPCCPRGCRLSAPRCGRGEAYAKTGMSAKDGVLPENGTSSVRGKAGFPGRLYFEKKEQQMIMKYLHHAVGVADHGGFRQEMAGKMFDVLTEEETAELMRLLGKLYDYWVSIAPEKPRHM